MTFALEDALESIGINTHIRFNSIPPIDSLSWKFALKSETHSNNAEIPLLLRYNIESFVYNNRTANKTTVLYLHPERYISIKSTSEFFKHINTHSPCRLIQCALELKNKESVFYYIHNGLILDSNYNPLLLITVNESYPKGSVKFRGHCFNLYLNPVIYSEQTPVNKYLIKEIIPFYANRKIAFRVADGEVRYQMLPVNIIISDKIKEFFCRPVEPKSLDIDEEINNLLLENIDDFIQ